MRSLIVAAVTLAVTAGSASAQPGDRLLVQRPALSQTHIVFVYGGDLWSGPARRRRRRAADGRARRRNQPGVLARRQPDRLHRRVRRQRGRVRHAAAGGVPKRLTWHPSADNVARLDARRQARALHVRADGLFPLHRAVHRRPGRRPAARLPLPMAAEGSYSPDGSRIAYVPAPARVQHLETLPRRRHDAGLAGDAGRLAGREGAARELQRLQPDVGGRQGLLPLRPRRARRRSTPTTRRRRRSPACSRTTASTSSRHRPARAPSCTSSSARSACST